MTEQPTRIKEILDDKSESLKNNLTTPSENVDTVAVKKNGGVRAGAGRPMGSMSQKNRNALEAKNYFIDKVHKNVDKIFASQFDLAIGEKVMMVKVKERNEEGKVISSHHEMVSDPELIAKYLDSENGDAGSDYEDINDENHYYYITMRPANNQALQGLLDRAFGKAPEKIQIEGGFFKAEQLNIQIVNPQKIEDENQNDPTETVIIEAESETELSA